MGNKIAKVKKGADGNWYITIRNRGNNKTVADCGEGYATKATAVRALRRNFGDGYFIVETGAVAKTWVEFYMQPKV
jgi:uncharacterized protein YegP (UPF0339 family)